MPLSDSFFDPDHATFRRGSQLLGRAAGMSLMLPSVKEDECADRDKRRRQSGGPSWMAAFVQRNLELASNLEHCLQTNGKLRSLTGFTSTVLADHGRQFGSLRHRISRRPACFT